MSFSEQTASFFDELSNIIDEQKKDNEGDINPETDRPFSSLLTQNDEPMDRPPQQALEEEPEVITRHSGGGTV